MYMVVSYNSIDCMNTSAKVAIDGIYQTKDEADARQIEICGGSVGNMSPDNNCKYGANGTISWIKEFELGDLERFDVKSPR
jgi:hypothetical protein